MENSYLTNKITLMSAMSESVNPAGSWAKHHYEQQSKLLGLWQ